LRGHWRQGVGRQVAHEIFRRRPGAWEVRVMRQNERALSFWRNTLGAWAEGRFQERQCDNERWRGVVFAFVSPQK
jgi:predicted acetyltransferase